MLRDPAKNELDGDGQRKFVEEIDVLVPSAVQPESGSEGHWCVADAGHRSCADAPRTELPGEGHEWHADEGQTSIAESGQPPLRGEGHVLDAEEATMGLSSALQPNHGEEGQLQVATTGQVNSADLAATIDAIRAHHRTRTYAMDQRKRADLSLGAFIRLALGWRKDAPDDERKRIADQAAALVAIGEAEAKGKEADLDEPTYIEWRHVILASIAARGPFDEIEKAATKEMERLAKTLPVWSWAEGVKGFGARSLAVIVGEAGDLSNYPKKGHLWKRLGLAPYEGKAYSTWRKVGGLGKDDWIEAGYSPKRRSAMYVIGDVMVKVGDRYRTVYLHRKDFERRQAEAAGLKVAPSAKIPKARAAEFISDGHVHRRAQRYMEKMLLRDLWQAWRSADADDHNKAAQARVEGRAP